MRKHFYLITEHEEEDRVGGVSVTDTRKNRSNKNKEEPLTILDKEENHFREVGKQVYLGYNDFDSEDPPTELYSEVMKSKIRSVDKEWAEKAGLDEAIYND